MSFDPKKTDVDKHIDLINTLGDMVNQKEEAKMEKFIETMPTMIQTYLIICKDWAETKDKAKSLEHIIQKCDLPTPAMPLVTTGATVPGLYSHIAHSVDKEEAEIPPPFKGAKPKQTRGRGKPKGKPQGHRQNPPKDQRQMNHIPMITLIIITIMTITLQSRGQRPQYNPHQFQNYRFQRGTYQSTHNQYSSHHKPYFQGNQSNLYRGRSHGHAPQQRRGCGHGRANYHNNNKYQYYTHDQQTKQYGPPCSLCGGFNHSPKHCYKGEHDINNIMEKMSINPHHLQQGNLYQ